DPSFKFRGLTGTRPGVVYDFARSSAAPGQERVTARNRKPRIQLLSGERMSIDTYYYVPTGARKAKATHKFIKYKSAREIPADPNLTPGVAEQDLIDEEPITINNNPEEL